MTELSIDIETYSPVDLLKCGLYRYVDHPDFEIILFAYAFDDEPVTMIDLLSGEKIPDRVLKALPDPNVKKTAHNVPFEFNCIEEDLGIKLDISQWEDTMIKGAMLGLPMSLDELGKVLMIDHPKMPDGLSLIKYFCCPVAATKTNGYRTRNYPHHDWDKWNKFKSYGTRDVVAERENKRKLAWFNIPEKEKALWMLDFEINRRGVRIDRTLCQNAIKIDALVQEKLLQECIDITGIEKASSVAQIKKWLVKQIAEMTEEGDNPYGLDEEDVKSLSKDVLPSLIEKFDNEKIKRVLEIRQLTSKTSTTKYKRMLQMVMDDVRIRGVFQFYGANRTGRFAGRGIQPHNFPRNVMRLLDECRKLIKAGKQDIFELIFEQSAFALSQLLRTAFVPAPGHCFYVSDYSAIEARVLAWLAGEEWVLEVFKGHGKIYEATASKMFKIPIESITKDSEWRQRGKIADLALGYQGSVGALAKMKAEKYGVKPSEFKDLVHAYREAHPKTKQLWYDVQAAVIHVLTTGERVTMQKGLTFSKVRGQLFITLPSGRNLIYASPYYDRSENQIKYYGVNQLTKQWGIIKTYGGKLVENIVQATARDIFCEGMLSVSKAGYPIVLHTHDETVSEVIEGFGSIAELNKLMCPNIEWAKDLPLKAEGFKSYYYKKE